ncbi:MAG: metal ABC transporter permease [Planctomycetota bacterium]|nr:metal ABC transporter permease [Planctomycetota bacterium]
MTSFFHDMADNPFLLTGLLAGLLASLACGLIGPYVITRRMVFLVGAIAHMAVGGIGAAVFLAVKFPDAFGWLSPVFGAVIAALIAAVLIAVVYDRLAERMDTLIGAMWAIGMSIGILLIKFTPGYHTELMSYLFGNIAIVPWSQIRLMVVLVAVIAGALLVFHKRLLAVCLDEEQAALQGVSIFSTNLVLLVLVALTVIALIQVVGLILVLALLTLPAATAGHYARRLAPIMLLSTILCMAFTTVPRVAVYGTAISPESAIVLAAGVVYLVSVAVRSAAMRRRAAPAT